MMAAIQGGAVPGNPSAVLLPPTTSQGGGENQDFGKVLQAVVSGPAAGASPKDLKSAAPVLGPSRTSSEASQNRKPASSREPETLTSLVPVAGATLIGVNVALPVVAPGITVEQTHSSGENPLPPKVSAAVGTCSPAVCPSVAAPAVAATYAMGSMPDSQKSGLANLTIAPLMPPDARPPGSGGTYSGTSPRATAEQDDVNRIQNSNSVVNCDDQVKAEILCTAPTEVPGPTESKSSAPSGVAVEPSNAGHGNQETETLHGTKGQDDDKAQAASSSQTGSSAQSVTATTPASDLIASVEIASISISDAHSDTAEPVAPAQSVAPQSHPSSSDSTLRKTASSTPFSINPRDGVVGTSDGDGRSQNLPLGGTPGPAGNNASPNTSEVKPEAARSKVAADAPTVDGKEIVTDKKHEEESQRASDSRSNRDLLPRETAAAPATVSAAAPEALKETSSSLSHTATAVLTVPDQASTASSPGQHKSVTPEQVAGQPSGSALSPRDQLAMEASPASVGSDMARILDRVGQSEMHIGMRTTAFGTVEVHTIVRENQVGLTIASEKGDLHSLFSSEVPGLQSTLRQHDLRLEDVRLLQQSPAAGTGTYSDSNPRQQSFQQTRTFYSSSAELEPAEVDSGQVPLLTAKTGLDIRA